jgi:hypothetical protein
MRAKVNKPGSFARQLLDPLRKYRLPGNAPERWFNVFRVIPPFLALFHETEEERKAAARNAIDLSLAAIRKYEPPYPSPGSPWYCWGLYRYIALTYDCCYDEMTKEERRLFQEEMLLICANVDIESLPTHPGNHEIVHAVAAGFCAMALIGDVPAKPRRHRDEEVRRGKAGSQGDFLRYRSGIRVESIGLAKGEKTYEEGKDFRVQWISRPVSGPRGYGISWLKRGKAPPPGTVYHVTYTFTPDLLLWQDMARRCLKRNLDHIWADGVYIGGVLYGTWTLMWAVDLIEAFRRTLGIDFGEHPAVRGALGWFLSEIVPTRPRAYSFPGRPNPPLGVRTNFRNDCHDYSFIVNGGHFPIWALTGFGPDAGGLDDIAFWILSRMNWRTWGGRDWMWVPEKYGPLPSKNPPKMGPCRSRFFRGVNLANYRTGSWEGPEEEWSLFSFFAGAFIGVEHDQTDKGSFTFFALGEDFAIDSSYAMGEAASDRTDAHNYLLIDGKGQPGPWASVGFVRSHFLSDLFDTVHGDLTHTFKSQKQWWSDPHWRTTTKWPVRKAERFCVFVKCSGRAPYVLVRDTVDKDGQPHTFDWLFHTQIKNKVAIEKDLVKITGRYRGAILNIHLLAGAPVTWKQERWRTNGAGIHPRLSGSVNAPNPHFLAILVPEEKDEATPLAVTRHEEEGFCGATVTGKGFRDVILCRRDASGPVKYGDLRTDAELAVVRFKTPGVIAGWTVQSGTVLECKGDLIWSLGPEKAPGSACFDGKTLAVSAPEAKGFRAFAPGVAGFQYEDRMIPVPTPEPRMQLVWEGKRPLRDVVPPGEPVLNETFSKTVAPGWTSFPFRTTHRSRVIDGELCIPGLTNEWVSYTKRIFGRIRADIYQWPRTHFWDARLKGEFIVHEWKGEGVFTIAGRVSDRKCQRGILVPDQDYVQVEMDPKARKITLASRVKGERKELGVKRLGKLARKKKHTFELTLEGNSVLFVLNGSKKFRWKEKSRRGAGEASSLPAEGYFQWGIPEGLHVHLDNIRIEIP